MNLLIKSAKKYKNTIQNLEKVKKWRLQQKKGQVAKSEKQWNNDKAAALENAYLAYKKKLPEAYPSHLSL